MQACYELDRQGSGSGISLIVHIMKSVIKIYEGHDAYVKQRAYVFASTHIWDVSNIGPSAPMSYVQYSGRCAAARNLFLRRCHPCCSSSSAKSKSVMLQHRSQASSTYSVKLGYSNVETSLLICRYSETAQDVHKCPGLFPYEDWFALKHDYKDSDQWSDFVTLSACLH